MAAGEYVSVNSQADTEKADLTREKKELETQPELELDELTKIYVDRGLEEGLAREVAQQLTAHDAITAHARDELSITSLTTARSLQAAIASAVTFAIGAVPRLAVRVVRFGRKRAQGLDLPRGALGRIGCDGFQ